MMDDILLFVVIFAIYFAIMHVFFALFTFIMSMCDQKLSMMFSRSMWNNWMREIKDYYSIRFLTFMSIILAVIMFSSVSKNIKHNRAEDKGLCTCECKACQQMIEYFSIATNNVKQIQKEINNGKK